VHAATALDLDACNAEPTPATVPGGC
jgi:hypothetical protein